MIDRTNVSILIVNNCHSNTQINNIWTLWWINSGIFNYNRFFRAQEENHMFVKNIINIKRNFWNEWERTLEFFSRFHLDSNMFMYEIITEIKILKANTVNIYKVNTNYSVIRLCRNNKTFYNSFVSKSRILMHTTHMLSFAVDKNGRYLS